MKTCLFFCLLMWSGLSCFTPKHFEVLETVAEKHIPGRKESSAYVQYQMVLETGKNSRKMTFSCLWVDQKSLPLKVYRKNGNHPISEFTKGDTLILYAAHFSENLEKEEERKTVPEAVKKSLSPVLEYTVGRKTNYREILFDMIEIRVNR